MSKVGRQEDADTITIETCQPFEHTKTPLSNEMKDMMNSNTEIGIVGYWRKNKSGVLSCYHFFYVPKPCKRLLRYSTRKHINGESSNANLFQVIYKSSDDELFLFFDQELKSKPVLHLALLNLNVNRFANNETIENRHFKRRSNLK